MNKRSFRLKFAFSLAIMSDGLLRETFSFWVQLFMKLSRRVSIFLSLSPGFGR